MTAPPIVTRGRIALWGAFLLALIVSPLVFNKGFALSLLCQIGIMTVFALSYNMLLGHTGLLSFGHAVYYGLGAFFTLHALNLHQALPIPVTLLPIVGGLAGLVFGVIFGYVSTKKAGTTFSMISLGIGEMVAAMSLMFPAVFGGEGGISGNRVTGAGLLGIDYGSQRQMYYLIAGWGFVCIVAMYALTQTPLGRMANAVRDNPERAEFVGYNTQRVRFFMLVLSGFFAGIAGGLAALNYEIATAETLSAHTSGAVILMTFVGGVGQFYGPIIGAALITVLQIAVSSVTQAWMLYFGIFFVAMVLYAPGGIASIIVSHERVWHGRLLRRLIPSYLVAAFPALLLAAGVISAVEMAYAMSDAVGDVRMLLFGVRIDPKTAGPWLGTAAAITAGALLLRRAMGGIRARWTEVNAELVKREMQNAEHAGAAAVGSVEELRTHPDHPGRASGNSGG
jgi:branched-chain amino acid transport system permease protein